MATRWNVTEPELSQAAKDADQEYSKYYQTSSNSDVINRVGYDLYMLFGRKEIMAQFDLAMERLKGPVRVLELGAGGGDLAVYALARYSDRVTQICCVDSCAAGLDFAKEWLRVTPIDASIQAKAAFVQADVANLAHLQQVVARDFTSAKPNIIFSRQCLYVLPDQPTRLREWSQLLDEGGVVVIHWAPNPHMHRHFAQQGVEASTYSIGQRDAVVTASDNYIAHVVLNQRSMVWTMVEFRKIVSGTGLEIDHLQTNSFRFRLEATVDETDKIYERAKAKLQADPKLLDRPEFITDKEREAYRQHGTVPQFVFECTAEDMVKELMAQYLEKRETGGASGGIVHSATWKYEHRTLGVVAVLSKSDIGGIGKPLQIASASSSTAHDETSASE